MAEKDIVLHTRLRFKPEGSDKYVVIFVETSADDILVNTPFSDIYDGKGTLKDLLDAMAQNLVKKPIRKTSQELRDSNPILADGQFGIESDTGVIKIGNGVDTYKNLEFEFKQFNTKNENLDFTGLNVSDDIEDIVDDNDEVKAAFIDGINDDEKFIHLRANELSIGTDDNHTSDIYFDIKEPFNEP